MNLSYILAMATYYHEEFATFEPLSPAQVDSLVLGTVNAPFKRSIDAQTLEKCLQTGDVGGLWLVHMSTFFREVAPRLVLYFAQAHGVADAQLVDTYTRVKRQTGVESKALESSLVTLAHSA